MRAADAAQCVAADGDEQILRLIDGARERGGDQQRLIDGAAQTGDAAHFIDGGTDDGEIEAVFTADVAVKNFADVDSALAWLG